MEEATSYAKISCRKLAGRTRRSRRCTKCRNRFCSSHSRMRQGPPPFAPCVPQRSTPFIFVASKWRFRYLAKRYCFFFDRILRWSHLFSTIRSTLATLTSTAYLFRYEFYGVFFLERYQSTKSISFRRKILTMLICLTSHANPSNDAINVMILLILWLFERWSGFSIEYQICICHKL